MDTKSLVTPTVNRCFIAYKALQLIFSCFIAGDFISQPYQIT